MAASDLSRDKRQDHRAAADAKKIAMEGEAAGHRNASEARAIELSIDASREVYRRFVRKSCSHCIASES